jgi:hypothetical protein
MRVLDATLFLCLTSMDFVSNPYISLKEIP